MKKLHSVIIGSGSYLPEKIIKNEDFLENEFFDAKGNKIPKENKEIIKKFEEITGITERRYIEDKYKSSDIATISAERAIADAGINKEDLDHIIVAHNFGDLAYGTRSSDLVPALASRVKYNLGIENPYCVAYDILFGCPGWLQAMIQANFYLKSNNGKYALVIGVENLSRVSDPHDIDSMIYSDGAGAVILEVKESNDNIGILNHLSRSDTKTMAWMLKMDKSYKKDAFKGDLFLKMNGRRIYEYAVNTVPGEIKKVIDQANIDIRDIKKVLLHQANEKMDVAMLKRVFKLYGITDIPNNIMPMIINKMGNNSVATLPIMYDKIKKGELNEHRLNSGDYIIFASVGAGLNVNVILYKVP